MDWYHLLADNDKFFVTTQPPSPFGTKAPKGLSARKEFGRVSS